MATNAVITGVRLLGLILSLPAFAALAAPGTSILIVTSRRVPAYEQAVDGIQSILQNSRSETSVITIGPGSTDSLADALDRNPSAIVAVGTAALDIVLASQYQGPVFATMVLSPNSSSQPNSKVAAAITLELAPSIVLTRLKELYPARSRIAVMRGPALSPVVLAEIRSSAQKLGYEIHVVECQAPKQLLETIGSMRGKVDFVWLFPDAALYPAPVVSALILAGIRNQLPLIGFSEGMVQTGALLAFYADYRDAGVQTGECVLRHLEGHTTTPHQRSRRVTGAINDRVVRVLGARYVPAAAQGMVIVK